VFKGGQTKDSMVFIFEEVYLKESFIYCDETTRRRGVECWWRNNLFIVIWLLVAAG
jgi:hypothetical protein